MDLDLWHKIKLKMPKSNNQQRETWYGSADLSDTLGLWYQDFEGISMHYITGYSKYNWWFNLSI